ALSDGASADCKVLVVGNPANTNCLIAMHNAPNIPDANFTAMTRLDHNRAMAQLAQKTRTSVNDITKMTIWGNHSATQYPDLFHAEVNGENAAAKVNDQEWLDGTFIPTVQKRGAAIIDARGSSSAASAASAAVDHMRSWAGSTPAGDWVSMGIVSDGSYGAPDNIITSYPCTTSGGQYSVVQGLDIDEYSRSKMERSWGELVEERDTVAGLGLLG
ncbi:MAG: malate dehydrogenase, partial [Actinobacteria bacterium]|nr:malate dehydrogenase [Actinomycetota bacterium]